jgi:hypothetical protein
VDRSEYLVKIIRSHNKHGHQEGKISFFIGDNGKGFSFAI